MGYKKKEEYIVYLGKIPFTTGQNAAYRTEQLDCWLADDTTRTSPVVARTRNKNEAVRLTYAEAHAEAKQVKGKVVKA